MHWYYIISCHVVIWLLSGMVYAFMITLYPFHITTLNYTPNVFNL